jgi:hypothetical protein
LLHGVRGGQTFEQKSNDAGWGFAQTPCLSELKDETAKGYSQGHQSQGSPNSRTDSALIIKNHIEDDKNHTRRIAADVTEDEDARTNQLAGPSNGRVHTSSLIHTLYLDALKESRTLRSPHCEVEQAKSLGVQVE